MQSLNNYHKEDCVECRNYVRMMNDRANELKAVKSKPEDKTKSWVKIVSIVSKVLLALGLALAATSLFLLATPVSLLTINVCASVGAVLCVGSSLLSRIKGREDQKEISLVKNKRVMLKHALEQLQRSQQVLNIHLMSHKVEKREATPREIVNWQLGNVV